MRAAFCVVLVLAASLPASDVPTAPAPRRKTLPTVEEMAAAREDVWGEAAIRALGGPSYEFFRDLLPPLRYVNTAFRHYPIVLSAPLAPVKARWVSNGSGVNLRADKPPMWKEVGTPVAFFVGEKGEAFGEDVTRLNGPQYVNRYQPVPGWRGRRRARRRTGSARECPHGGRAVAGS